MPPRFTYREPNRVERRAIRRVARLVANESPAERRKRERGEAIRRYSSTPAERRALVRAQLRSWLRLAAWACVPLALALAYQAGARP
jgi:hypothetical protein